MNELTPVEWLTKKLEERFMGLAPSWICDIISQAKEMEKEKLEKLKDFETWKEWKNEPIKTNQDENSN